MKKISVYTVALVAGVILSFNLCLGQSLNYGKNQNPANFAGGYNFSYDTATYKNLDSSTNLSEGIVWDYVSLMCPIGFTFKFFNIPFDTAWVSDPFDVDFGEFVGGGFDYFITPFGADLVDRAFGDGSNKPKSPISYLLEGTAPSRILKIEWKNSAFLCEILKYNTRTNYINLQLWLYETTNNIEIHFGPQLVTYLDTVYNTNAGPIISLSNNKNSKYVTLIGDSNKPTVSSLPELRIKGTPPNKMVYKFTSTWVGVSEQAATEFSVYPNPVQNWLNLSLNQKSERVEVQILNLLGEELYSKLYTNTDRIKLDAGYLEPGTYLVKIRGSESVSTKKFVKQ